MINYALEDLSNDVTEMIEAIESICLIGAKPFNKTRSSDEVKYVP